MDARRLLTINTGSSSLKAALYRLREDTTETPELRAEASRIGGQGGGVIRQIIPALVEGLAAVVREAHAAAPAPDLARLSPKLRLFRRVLPQAVQGNLQAGRTSVDSQQTPCVRHALHFSRSGARFSTECRWWVTWL